MIAPAWLDESIVEPGKMLLFWSSRSPYARKATIAAHEHGLFEQISLMPVEVSLVSRPPMLAELNPLGQIPTLVTFERRVLFDSLVICDHFDLIGAAAPLVPRGERSSVLSRHAMVQGMIEAMVAWRSERNRAEDARRDQLRAAYQAKIMRVLDMLDADTAPADRFDLGDVALACALAYGEFREVIPQWRDSRPRLAARYDELSARPSVRATVFREPASATA
jgi:glutathione S-transferase